MKTLFSLFILLFIICSSCGHEESKVQAPPKPSGNCSFSRDEKNPVGKRIRIVQDEKFISLTIPDSLLKSKSENNEFFKGYLSCISVDTVMGIYMNFKIYYENVFEHYGLIKKDNTVMFILKSGRSVELPFGRTFSGNTDLSRDFTEYSSFVYLPSDAEAMLTSEELHRVKISWTKREEEYQVVNPGIFINQLACLK